MVSRIRRRDQSPRPDALAGEATTAARKLIDGCLLNPIILGSLALLALIVGTWIFVDPLEEDSGSLVSLRAIAEAQPGEVCVAEGRLGPANQAAHRNLVAFLSEEYRSVGRSSSWQAVSQTSQPLVVTTTSGDVAIINEDYSLENARSTMQERPPTLTRGAARSRGFVVGEQLFAVGPRAQSQHGLAMHAYRLYPGTRAAWIESTVEGGKRERYFGGWTLALGVGLAALTWFALRRVRGS